MKLPVRRSGAEAEHEVGESGRMMGAHGRQARPCLSCRSLELVTLESAPAVGGVINIAEAIIKGEEEWREREKTRLHCFLPKLYFVLRTIYE